ncbi:MAG: creatininase family protein [Caldilineaceae bacterium]|nr:creatininase family protein [Caldilineaceae bacterium]
MTERHLARLTWTDIAALDKDEGVVILPVGAIEQHGPHLPVLTDTLLVTHVLDATLARLPDDVRAWALPPLNYGKSNEHTGFPGTLSLTAATLTAVLHDIADSVRAAGFRRLAFINGHGGNMALLDVAARDIRVATGLQTFCLHPMLYVEPPFPITPEERRLGFHAGELETSLVLAIDPALVHMERAVRHFAAFPETETPLFFFGHAAAAWLSRDWSRTGVFGDATIASATKGEQILAVAVDRLVPLITAISRFEPPAGDDDGGA